MASTETGVLADLFGRIREGVAGVLQDLEEAQLGWRPGPEANSIAWLVWHLTRVQDDHLADAAGRPQVWTEQGWDARFGLPFDASATGYGQAQDEVTALSGVSGELLAGYHAATAQRTGQYLAGLEAGALSRVVDRSYDPPVTLGVRLVSVIADDLQHVGQAAYLRGLLGR